MCRSKSRVNRRGRRLINGQLFIQVGKNRYIPVDKPRKEANLFVWDDKRNRILPFNSFYHSEKYDFSSICGANFSGIR